VALYLDTSALVKLVAVERESDDLRAFVGGQELVTSLIARTELVRAVARKHERMIEQAEDVLSELAYIAVNRLTTGAAAWVQPWSLRSQDALHVASAARMNASLKALVTYDKRMIHAATRAGLPVASPGGAAA
jgi:predicted nucleic acid-binding protein